MAQHRFGRFSITAVSLMKDKISALFCKGLAAFICTQDDPFWESIRLWQNRHNFDPPEMLPEHAHYIR